MYIFTVVEWDSHVYEVSSESIGHRALTLYPAVLLPKTDMHPLGKTFYVFSTSQHSLATLQITIVRCRVNIERAYIFLNFYELAQKYQRYTYNLEHGMFDKNYN